MRLLKFFTRDPLLKLTALILALLLWALVETGSRSDSGTVTPGAPELGDSTQSRFDPTDSSGSIPVTVRLTGPSMEGPAGTQP